MKRLFSLRERGEMQRRGERRAVTRHTDKACFKVFVEERSQTCEPSFGWNVWHARPDGHELIGPTGPPVGTLDRHVLRPACCRSHHLPGLQVDPERPSRRLASSIAAVCDVLCGSTPTITAAISSDFSSRLIADAGDRGDQVQFQIAGRPFRHHATEGSGDLATRYQAGRVTDLRAITNSVARSLTAIRTNPYCCTGSVSSYAPYASI